MDFLDQLLTGQRNNRRQAQQDMIRSLAESRVVNMSEKGIQFATPDMRTSTALARNAVRDSTQGRVQPGPGMFTQVGDPIGFREVQGEAFHRLTAAGIGPGSSMLDVFKALEPARGSQPTPQSQNALQRSDGNNTRQSAQPNPGTSLFPLTGNGYALNSGQAKPTDNYQAGYLSQTPDSLNDLQLDTFIQQQSQNFQRLLHSALFSDY